MGPNVGLKQQPRSQDEAGTTSDGVAHSCSDSRAEWVTEAINEKSGKPYKRRFSALHLVGQESGIRTGPHFAWGQAASIKTVSASGCSQGDYRPGTESSISGYSLQSSVFVKCD